MMSSFLATTIKTTLCGLPFSFSRSAKMCRTGLWFEATRAAICLSEQWPIPGKSPIKFAVGTGPIPGMDRKISARLERFRQLEIAFSIDSSKSAICRVKRLSSSESISSNLWLWRCLTCLRRRFLISTSCRRLVCNIAGMFEVVPAW